MNTIVCCQKTKMNLNLSSNTNIQKWMRNIYHSVISLLPIFFDWVGSDVVSRYGFNVSSFRSESGDNKYTPNQDLEANVEEFLEKRGGIPLAIAVVFSEHGSSVTGNDNSFITNQCVVAQAENIISAFPAVYMRSPINHNSPNKKNSGTKDPVAVDTFEKDTSTNFRVRTLHSWPYTSWTSLVSYLKRTLSSVSGDDSAEIQWSQIDSETWVSSQSINDNMWLIAMRKSADDNRWNRKSNEERPGKEEEKFFIEFSTALRLRDIFKSVLETIHLESDSFVGETLKQEGLLFDNDSTRSQLLESFKGELGLRSSSSKVSYSVSLRKRSAKKSPRLIRQTTKISNNSSHCAFFLGSHLMDSIHLMDE
jgi:hypothetical protein